MFKPRYPHLCSPLKVGPLTLRNRMASAPTSLATLGPGGHPSLENIAYYELRAKGGACIVTMGDVIVHGTGLAHPEAVLLTDPDVLPPWCRWLRRSAATGRWPPSRSTTAAGRPIPCSPATTSPTGPAPSGPPGAMTWSP